RSVQPNAGFGRSPTDAAAPSGHADGTISTWSLSVEYTIVPIGEAHIAGFHASIDEVAREHRYLALLEGPPLGETEAFVRKNIGKGNPQFVAESAGRVIRWCDAIPMERPVFSHRAVLAMGVLAPFRGRGIGRALIDATLTAARTKGVQRID